MLFRSNTTRGKSCAEDVARVANESACVFPLLGICDKSLNEADVRYLPLEKAILAVVYATRKLPHYFQAHTVVVLTQLPLKSVLRSANYTRRIAKWGTILGAFDIKYMPRTAIKGQVLADLRRWKGKIRNWEKDQSVWYLSNAQRLRNCTLMGQRTS